MPNKISDPQTYCGGHDASFEAVLAMILPDCWRKYEEKKNRENSQEKPNILRQLVSKEPKPFASVSKSFVKYQTNAKKSHFPKAEISRSECFHVGPSLSPPPPTASTNNHHIRPQKKAVDINCHQTMHSHDPARSTAEAKIKRFDNPTNIRLNTTARSTTIDDDKDCVRKIFMRSRDADPKSTTKVQTKDRTSPNTVIASSDETHPSSFVKRTLLLSPKPAESKEFCQPKKKLKSVCNTLPSPSTQARSLPLLPLCSTKILEKTRATDKILEVMKQTLKATPTQKVKGTEKARLVLESKRGQDSKASITVESATYQQTQVPEKVMILKKVKALEEKDSEGASIAKDEGITNRTRLRKESKSVEKAPITEEVRITEEDRDAEKGRIFDKTAIVAKETKFMEKTKKVSEQVRIGDGTIGAKETRIAAGGELARKSKAAGKEKIVEEERLADETKATEEARFTEKMTRAEKAKTAEEACIVEKAKVADKAKLTEAVGIAMETKAATKEKSRENSKFMEDAKVAEETDKINGKDKTATNDLNSVDSNISVGARVYAKFSDDEYYWGNVECVSKTSKTKKKSFLIFFEDGDILEGVTDEHILTEADYRREFGKPPPSKKSSGRGKRRRVSRHRLR
mmetsp:Transcript_12107/g.17534  ORF Transcript_12107/g.17534 Transcript_12107/m.17534 type:complete len:630 (-) Transcript_12107:649-2538(-)